MKYFFIISGAKFYFDWILLTNPVSKNSIIRFLMSPIKDCYSAINYKSRLNLAIILFTIHFLFAIFSFFMDFKFFLNILVNIYPCIVNFYIGYRCYIIKKFKKNTVNNII
jgi:hypothetical protein